MRTVSSSRRVPDAERPSRFKPKPLVVARVAEEDKQREASEFPASDDLTHECTAYTGALILWKNCEGSYPGHGPSGEIAP